MGSQSKARRMVSWAKVVESSKVSKLTSRYWKGFFIVIPFMVIVFKVIVIEVMGK